MISIIFTGCRNDLETKSLPGKWQLPIANGSLGISNFVADSLLTTKGADSSLEIYYEKSLVNYSLKNLVEPIETEFFENIKLSSIELGDQRITKPISLGEVAKGAGVTGVVIIANNGNKMPIPPVNNIPSSDFPIDATDFFESMTLSDGFVDVSFSNGFPIDVSNLIYQVKNTQNQNVLFSDTIPLIAAGTNETRTYPLSGKTVEGSLTASILEMSSPGTNGDSVLIDTSDALVIEMLIRDLVPTEATAIFPRQTLADDVNVRRLTADDNLKLTSMVLRSGMGVMDAASTIQDSIRFIYSIPSLSLNGTPFSFSGVIPPAPPGGVSEFNKTFDLTGYTLDLTGPNQDTFNTFYDHMEAYIDSSGTLTYLSLEDSLYINSFTGNVLPEIAFGEIERDTVEIGPETLETDLFSRILQGNIVLDDAEVTFDFSNSVGVPIDVVLGNLSSKGVDGNLVSLNSSWLGQSQNFPAALYNAGSIQNNAQAFPNNPSNSNILPFIENLPVELGYEGQIIVNPNEEVSNSHFMHYEDGFEIGLGITLPLEIGLDQLVLEDTLDWNLNLDLSQSPQGKIKIKALNYFPFSANLHISFLDDLGSEVLQYSANPALLAANVETDGKVSTPADNTLEWNLSLEDLETLVDAKKAVLRIEFGSHPNPEKLFADYSIDLNIVGEWEFGN